MSKSKINPKGSSWEELEKQLFTSEEIAESEVRVAIINEMIKAREENGITQKQLEAMSGIKQPVISRMENGTSDPQLSTVLKIKFIRKNITDCSNEIDKRHLSGETG